LGEKDKELVNRLYRFELIEDELVNPNILFEMTSSRNAIHNGGKMVIGPDNNIYLTIGDIDGRNTMAQNVLNGSLPDGSSGIIRITQNGSALDKGLIGNLDPLNKYYAYGIRNSFGIDFDQITSKIWITDNGPQYGDEMNLVEPGFNGGWKAVMGMSYLSKDFNEDDLVDFDEVGKYYDPVFEWQISTGVTDLIFLKSDKLGKEYENDLFIGEVNEGYLYHFNLNQSRTGLLLNGSLADGIANNNVEKREAAIAQIDGGIIGLEVGPDGLLYIATTKGEILRLSQDPTMARTLDNITLS